MTAETTAEISLGDATVTEDAADSLVEALASQYNTSDVVGAGAAVLVTLMQELIVTMGVDSDLSAEGLCEVRAAPRHMRHITLAELASA